MSACLLQVLFSLLWMQNKLYRGKEGESENESIFLGGGSYLACKVFKSSDGI